MIRSAFAEQGWARTFSGFQIYFPMNAAQDLVSPPLSELPNISAALDEALNRVAMSSPEALKLAGAEAAWTRLHQNGFHPSIQTLLALEGAIRGVDWQSLPAARRFELVRFAARTR